MPAYHQIEVYVDLTPGFALVREQLITLGEDLAWIPPVIVQWLRDQAEPAQPAADDDGWPWVTAHSPRFDLVLGERLVPVWWMLYEWRLPDIPKAWLTWQLMVDYDSVNMRPDGYRSGVLTDVWSIMAAISAQLPTGSVFWTDEVQDGVAWNGIVRADRARCWQFDLAIIPDAHGVLYRPLHPAFVQHMAGSVRWFAARHVGPPPWGADDAQQTPCLD